MVENSADGGKRVKSAYELALERLDDGGIERPRTAAFDSATIAAMADTRSRAEARLAELEILHGRQLGSTRDPNERGRLQADYRAERQRVEERRDREIQDLRSRS